MFHNVDLVHSEMFKWSPQSVISFKAEQTELSAESADNVCQWFEFAVVFSAGAKAKVKAFSQEETGLALEIHPIDTRGQPCHTERF